MLPSPKLHDEDMEPDEVFIKLTGAPSQIESGTVKSTDTAPITVTLETVSLHPKLLFTIRTFVFILLKPSFSFQ